MIVCGSVDGTHPHRLPTNPILLPSSHLPLRFSSTLHSSLVTLHLPSSSSYLLPSLVTKCALIDIFNPTKKSPTLGALSTLLRDLNTKVLTFRFDLATSSVVCDDSSIDNLEIPKLRHQLAIIAIERSHSYCVVHDRAGDQDRKVLCCAVAVGETFACSSPTYGTNSPSATIRFLLSLPSSPPPSSSLEILELGVHRAKILRSNIGALYRLPTTSPHINHILSWVILLVEARAGGWRRRWTPLLHTPRLHNRQRPLPHRPLCHSPVELETWRRLLKKMEIHRRTETLVRQTAQMGITGSNMEEMPLRAMGWLPQLPLLHPVPAKAWVGLCQRCSEYRLDASSMISWGLMALFLRNIVATVNLDCRLDLKTIALHARNAEYNPKVLTMPCSSDS